MKNVHMIDWQAVVIFIPSFLNFPSARNGSGIITPYLQVPWPQELRTAWNEFFRLGLYYGSPSNKSKWVICPTWQKWSGSNSDFKTLTIWCHSNHCQIKKYTFYAFHSFDSFIAVKSLITEWKIGRYVYSFSYCIHCFFLFFFSFFTQIEQSFLELCGMPGTKGTPKHVLYLHMYKSVSCISQPPIFKA